MGAKFKQDFRVWLCFPVVPDRMGSEWRLLVEALRRDLTPAEYAYEVERDERAKLTVSLRRAVLLTVGISIQRRNDDFRLTGLSHENKRSLNLTVDCFDGLYEVIKEMSMRGECPLPAPKSSGMELMYQVLAEGTICPPHTLSGEIQRVSGKTEFVTGFMQPARKATWTLNQKALREVIPIGKLYSYYVAAWAVAIAEKDQCFRRDIFNPYLEALSKYTRQVRLTGGLYADFGDGPVKSVQGQKKFGSGSAFQ
jgi:hypothetical protein